jgi:hypothetical protein
MASTLADKIDGWYLICAITKRLGHQIVYDSKLVLDMNIPPSTDDLLAVRAAS